MARFQNIVSGIGGRLFKHGSAEPGKPLNKASYIELFFDLTFIFCMRSILPIVADVETGSVDWYSYYTFWFTFALMLQIWFNSTIYMNRFGTGGVRDIIFLFTTMFLLSVMTRAISTGWERYAIYNVCWVLICLNTMVHWALQYRRLANPSPQLVRDTRLVMGVLGAQMILVLASHLLPKNPAQVVCLLALLLGFVFWYAGSREPLGEENRDHLAERCALLMILTFGETIVGLGNGVPTNLNLFTPITYFLLVIGMFLVYLNEIVNLLDLERLGSGRLYMALSAWMTFCVANVTAGFELSLKSMDLMGVTGDIYFGISVAVFLLSFFLFTPFNRYRRPSVGWNVARAAACLLVLAHSSTLAISARRLLGGIASTAAHTPEEVFVQLGYAMPIIAVAAVYAVLSIDRIAVRRERRRRRLAEARLAELAAAAPEAAIDSDAPPTAVDSAASNGPAAPRAGASPAERTDHDRANPAV